MGETSYFNPAVAGLVTDRRRCFRARASYFQGGQLPEMDNGFLAAYHNRQVRNGCQAIRVHFHVEGDAPAEELRALVLRVAARSAVYDMLPRARVSRSTEPLAPPSAEYEQAPPRGSTEAVRSLR